MGQVSVVDAHDCEPLENEFFLKTLKLLWIVQMLEDLHGHNPIAVRSCGVNGQRG